MNFIKTVSECKKKKKFYRLQLFCTLTNFLTFQVFQVSGEDVEVLNLEGKDVEGAKWLLIKLRWLPEGPIVNRGIDRESIIFYYHYHYSNYWPKIDRRLEVMESLKSARLGGTSCEAL